LFSPDLVNSTGDAVEGFLVTSPILRGAEYDAFIARYQAKFGTLPMGIFHAQAYDAINIVKAAIEKVAVQEVDGTINIPRQALRDAVAATKDFTGISGVLTCNVNGDCANPIIGVYEYHTDQFPPTLIWSNEYLKTPVIPFKVGLVTGVGKINDKSFNQTAWEGIQKAFAEGNADFIQYIETTDSRDFDKNIATFADAGYNIIVTVGFNLTDATYNAAKKYPEVYFIGIDQSLSRDANHPDWPLANLVSINYNEDQLGFLVGALGAMMSDSHKIGAVCGTDAVPPVWRYGEGYKAGATYEDAKNGTNTEVTVVYHNDASLDKAFTDPIWGSETANRIIDKGADVIFGCGGMTGNGAVDAAAQRKVYVIGVDTDQYYTMPEAASQLLSSALKLEREPVAAIIALTREGKFPIGGSYIGPSGYAPYHDLDSKVPINVKTEMEAIFRGLINGSIKTNVPPFKPTE
jgi:basic membrane protein A